MGHLEPTDPPCELRADCTRCFGLCCVAPAFAASADFAFDKAAGQACRHLGQDFRCQVHDHLRQIGCPGCAVFDCLGAGQRVSQITFGGSDWRQAPGAARHMFAVFHVMRALHELLWYLAEALALDVDRAVQSDVRLVADEIERAARGFPDALLSIDLAACQRRADGVLSRVSELARASARRPRPGRRGLDLVGAKLRGADLRGENLRGAQLIGADLRRADLRLADLIGADLRGSDLRGADLSTSLFLTPSQVNAARGDSETVLSRRLARPAHWGDAGTQDARERGQDQYGASHSRR